MVTVVRWSKTIQFRQRHLLIPVMCLPMGHPLCPVQAYEDHLQANPQLPSSPAFFFTSGSCAVSITHTTFTSRLRVSLQKANIDPRQYSGHFTAVVPLTPSAVGHPWNWFLFKVTGLPTLFCYTSHSPSTVGCPWGSLFLRHLAQTTPDSCPSPPFLSSLLFEFGCLGRPHPGLACSTLAAALLISGKLK